ncbi:endonuclease/exonuclease/phosphatase family protein [Lewinella sp. IMCC34183]|uniref:endonuclease/exonuclease/phosphatase family protein n=1 Tax=Lewinella sp. IMCC34183 TaxID=2248762 RepID=UPI000E21D9EA|nr:endonuclease/exonuclease/phosphatase family protein [Lewinella sp. IMCC34183]
MKTLRSILLYFVIAVATVVVVLSLLSLVYDVSYWYTKVLDFPRTQYLIVAVACLLLLVPLMRRWNAAATALMLGLTATVLIQGWDVAPYLIGPREVPDAEAGGDNAVSIMLANVLITNRQSDAFLNIVSNTAPDLLLVMENDRWWEEQLTVLDRTYPHSVKYPAGNGYGMTLFSRLPLADNETLFFNQDSVPSFHVRVTLPSGAAFTFHAMHPVAPVPSKEYPDNKGEKEVAFGKLADLLARDSLPVIVAGDFNDVSWSHTSRLFQDAGNLSNVRLGRGLYNSFDATSWYMRWPLDHYFVSGQWGVARLERLPAFGSDHFPMYAEFVLR